MNLKEVQKLITSVTDSGTLEFKLNSEEVKIVVKTNTGDKEIKMIRPVINGDHIVSQVNEILKNSLVNNRIKGTDLVVPTTIIVKSPFIGTFLLQSSLGKSSGIKIGDNIKKGDILCRVEALTLFNEVKSDVSGKIIEILVEDFTPVEYDQSLFVITLS